MVRRIVVLLALLAVGTSCSHPSQTEADRVTPPKQDACRDLRAADLGKASNASPVVPCSRAHTAQTFAVGTLPASTGTSYGDRRHGSFVYRACGQKFRDFLGIDDSLAMRIQLSWAWFRPSERGWSRGARWYRCDVVGGSDGARTLRDLPPDARTLFATAPPDAWLTCAKGAAVSGSTKVPCSEPHDWRAVSTVKVGQPADPYPGDRIVQVRSRDRCSDWVGAWTNYATDYDFGYTWFHEEEWSTGNRRSICWARTEK